jgi:hypothetical protein
MKGHGVIIKQCTRISMVRALENLIETKNIYAMVPAKTGERAFQLKEQLAGSTKRIEHV